MWFELSVYFIVYRIYEFFYLSYKAVLSWILKIMLSSWTTCRLSVYIWQSILFQLRITLNLSLILLKSLESGNSNSNHEIRQIQFNKPNSLENQWKIRETAEKRFCVKWTAWQLWILRSSDQEYLYSARNIPAQLIFWKIIYLSVQFARCCAHRSASFFERTNILWKKKTKTNDLKSFERSWSFMKDFMLFFSLNERFFSNTLFKKQ